MNSCLRKTGFCVSSLGSLGTIFSTSLAMGCCAGLLAPLASAGAAVLPFLSPSFQMPLLYATGALTLVGLVLSYRSHRSGLVLFLGFLGLLLLLIPFHTALEVNLFYLLIGLGLGILLIASWGPLIWRFFNGLRVKSA